MQKWTKNLRLLLTLTCALVASVSTAQFTLFGQLRTRTEVRNGLGNLVPKGAQAAVFTSQRTRLSLGYKWDRINFGIAIQDVRVWGQDASSISNADGNRLMLHEGWADITLANKADSTITFRWVDQLSLKVGRQELNYDDVRLVGNLDWLQQARRHDMALLKMLHKGWQVNLGYAFGQNTDAFGYTGTTYVPGNVVPYVKNSEGVLVPTPAGLVPLSAGGSVANNSSKNGSPVFLNPPNTNAASQAYKSFTSLYISKTFKQTKFSALYFNDRFGKYAIDSVFSDGGIVYGRRFTKTSATDPFDYAGVSSRFTYGLMINQAFGNEKGFGKVAIQTAYYQQSGKNRDGVALNAYHFTLAATYMKGKMSITPGFDVLSGNDAGSPSGKDNRFDPLYGTPHKHWGSMDYFYVGTGSPAGGLNNFYIKTKYTGKALAAGVDIHSFSLNKNMLKANGETIGKKLGTEIDLLLNYNLNKITNLELGYSLMAATNSMPFAKGQALTDQAASNYRKSGTWFYAMLRISPEFFNSKSN
ncbi:alginate export family protein [Flavihumibacter fluvii]|uniref:alginate export family protein n=1 Tax=Flavihumibacter fluvii TaxID=2838157 RepID=UPI001BDE9163|nr:alginate export family protein [Flavihumibacter fluvii]ULQ52812.1 alginate export family protein [Flavihumibacter fluvii]